MHIGTRCFYRGHITRTCIHTNMHFHPKTPLIALLRLVHFRVTFFLLVLSRSWCVDDGRIDNCATPHHLTSPFERAVDSFKHRFPKTIFFQQTSEVQKGRGIRCFLTHEVNSHELAHGITVIDSVFYPFVRQAEPYLQQVHPQHLFNPHRRTASLAAKIIWLNQNHPFIPGNNFIHNIQKLFAFGYSGSSAVFNITECLLFHDFFSKHFFDFLCNYFTIKVLWDGINQ